MPHGTEDSKLDHEKAATLLKGVAERIRRDHPGLDFEAHVFRYPTACTEGDCVVVCRNIPAYQHPSVATKIKAIHGVGNVTFTNSPPPPPLEAPEKTESTRTTWTCRIGILAGVEVPDGGDAPMRAAVEEAFYKVTGQHAEACFSGWGDEFTEGEKAVITGDYSTLVEPEPVTPKIVASHTPYAPQAVAAKLIEKFPMLEFVILELAPDLYAVEYKDHIGNWPSVERALRDIGGEFYKPLQVFGGFSVNPK
jgi:hypothetical protein